MIGKLEGRVRVVVPIRVNSNLPRPIRAGQERYLDFCGEKRFYVFMWFKLEDRYDVYLMYSGHMHECYFAFLNVRKVCEVLRMVEMNWKMMIKEKNVSERHVLCICMMVHRVWFDDSRACIQWLQHIIYMGSCMNACRCRYTQIIAGVPDPLLLD